MPHTIQVTIGNDASLKLHELLLRLRDVHPKAIQADAIDLALREADVDACLRRFSQGKPRCATAKA